MIRKTYWRGYLEPYLIIKGVLSVSSILCPSKYGIRALYSDGLKIQNTQMYLGTHLLRPLGVPTRASLWVYLGNT